MTGLERLTQPPWSTILGVAGGLFLLWLAYLALPTLVRLVRMTLNLAGRRADRRTLGWSAALILTSSLLIGAVEFITHRLHPDLQYFIYTGVQLVVVIIGVLLVVSFITWLVMAGFAALGGPLLSRGYVLFVGWNLLRSHTVTQHEPREYEGGHKPRARWVLPLGLLALAVPLLADRAPLPRLLGDGIVWVPALKIGFFALAAILLTWPLRRLGRAGTIDRLDRFEAGVKNLPNVLTVTVTTFISVVGVGVGIWALVVVLSVMSGFENDLRSKILSTNPHIVVQDSEPMEGIGHIDRKLNAYRAIPGVVSAIPYVQGDVIVTSRENRNVSLTLRGIEPSGIAHAEHHLRTSIIAGRLDNLLEPEQIVPTARWRLRQGDMDADPLGAPLDPRLEEEPTAPKTPAKIPGQAATEDTSASDPEPAEPDPLAPAEIPGSDDDDPLAPAEIPGVNNEDDYLEDEGIRPGILLGKELAGSLRVAVGSEVTVVSPQDGAGFLGIQPRARTFRVAGIFNTGMYEFDLKLAYIRMSEAQRFFHMGSDVNRIELRLADADNSEVVTAEVRKSLDRPSLEALDWKALNRNLFSALALEKIVMFIVLGFIILVASFNVIGSLVMIIIQKSREIAILKSMGSTSGEIRRIFLVLGGFIGGIGSSAGLLVGLLTCGFIRYVGVPLPRQYYIDLLPVHVDPLTTGGVYLAGIGLCLLATLYPAAEAARIHPVEGLRYE